MESDRILRFLQSTTCYDLLPLSSKQVVFDRNLLVKKALAALLQHSLQAAALWDTHSHSFCGLLTVTDFILLILYYYQAPSPEEENINQLRISRLKEIVMKNNVNYSLHPMDSILDAAHTLLQHKLHRLPLIDASPPSTPGNDHQETLLYIMNQYHILACLASWLFESSDLDLAFLDFTPESQGIGTFAPNLASVDSTTPLINLLSLFISQGVSSLPVLDSEGRVETVVEKYDVLNLAREGHRYDLALPLSEALKSRQFNENINRIHVCSQRDTIRGMMDLIRRRRVHRFIVQTDEAKLVGIVGLSDLLAFFIKQR